MVFSCWLSMTIKWHLKIVTNYLWNHIFGKLLKTRCRQQLATGNRCSTPLDNRKIQAGKLSIVRGKTTGQLLPAPPSPSEDLSTHRKVCCFKDLFKVLRQRQRSVHWSLPTVLATTNQAPVTINKWIFRLLLPLFTLPLLWIINVQLPRLILIFDSYFMSIVIGTIAAAIPGPIVAIIPYTISPVIVNLTFKYFIIFLLARFACLYFVVKYFLLISLQNFHLFIVFNNSFIYTQHCL